MSIYLGRFLDSSFGSVRQFHGNQLPWGRRATVKVRWKLRMALTFSGLEAINSAQINFIADRMEIEWLVIKENEPL
jgi:hypothetical protein